MTEIARLPFWQLHPCQVCGKWMRDDAVTVLRLRRGFNERIEIVTPPIARVCSMPCLREWAVPGVE